MNICILIPCYNEEAAIGKLVRQIREKNFPVIVIDDGSKDRSVEMAQQAGAEVIVQEKNHGKGHTLKLGIQHILDSTYDGVLMMDGDGQHSVEDIETFIKEAEKTPDCIINGNRMHNPADMPWVRVQTNKVMSAIISWGAGQKIPDTQCGYRYIGKKVLEMIRLETENFEIETEILLKAAKSNFKILSVPVQTIYGNEESSIRPFRDTIKFIVYYFKEIFS